MSMRSYSGLLVLEDIFDYVPTSNPDISSLASMLFTPNVPVVSADCGTTLGNFQTVNYELEGYVELATGTLISKDRIDQLLFTGTYEVATRSLSTCIAPGGVCQTCYHATVQDVPVPTIGSRVTIQPEYPIKTDVIGAVAGDTSWQLSLAPVSYQFVYIYINGTQVLSPNYTITDTTLTLTQTITSGVNIVVRYTSYNKSPFLVFLAETYSGSVLGMLPLPAPMLPLRSLLLSSIIPQSKLDVIAQYTQNNKLIPSNFVEYIDAINDTLEKTLYVLAINSIYANVTS